MKVFKFKAFTSNKDFVEWQLEQERVIIQIQPIVSSFGMDIYEKTAHADANCAIYVIYSEEV